MVNSISYNRIKSIVSNAKARAEERAYYSSHFKITDIRKAGIIPVEAISKLDKVVLDRQLNESILFTGVNHKGSSFELSLSIVNLYDNVQQPQVESKWRFAKVSFELWNNLSKCRYTYSVEQLIDYENKIINENDADERNFYKIGCLSLEIVSPYSLSRILLNGNVRVTKQESNETKVLPVKITISSHCTSDKFDYKTRFNVQYTVDIIEKSLENDSSKGRLNSATSGSNGRSVQDSAKTIQSKNNKRLSELMKVSSKDLLELVREDRIDTPMMFQLEIEHYDTEQMNLNGSDSILLWGSKSKRLAPVRPKILFYNPVNHRENLFIWAYCGHLIHLSRPINYPNLVYGCVHNNFDYTSYLYDAKLFKRNLIGNDEELNLVQFDCLSSFEDLSENFVIRIIGFKEKEYTIKFKKQTDDMPDQRWRKVEVNDFEGLARWSPADYDIELVQREAQKRLFALPIRSEDKNSDGSNSEPLIGLASEHLLGGKGNSLIHLAHLCGTNFKRKDVNGAHIRVPKGLVVTCVAYQVWLRSSPLIISSIRELDAARRVFSARSYYVNPLSSNQMNIAQRQSILREQCRKTSLVLNSCPLPALLRRHLHKQLVDMFGSKCLTDPSDQDDSDKSIKTFAVRSSAVGEDSLETSAAGQMRTILDARGFNSICRSIVECWSSQFELEAVTYKSQNGLKFNMPMAVVVQELIDCQVAGVAATCDPLTGNDQRLEITANLGSGEGVVAGKQTDTIRVDLRKFPSEHNRTNDILISQHWCEKIVGRKGEQCCLEGPQIISLADLLLELRSMSSIKNREVEWGITNDYQTEQSSSSSDGSSGDEIMFNIHLFQSRPLTHLQRLSGREIDHEHDQGIASPLDIVSRANFSEVMPGAMCRMYSSYFITAASSFASSKPFEKNHTRNAHAADVFGFHSQVATIVLSYSDAIRRFLKMSEAESAESNSILNSMLGSTLEHDELRERRNKLRKEKVSPLSVAAIRGLSELLALDLGMLKVYKIDMIQSSRSTKLEDDLPEINKLVEELETDKSPVEKLDNESNSGINYCIPLDQITDISRRPVISKLRQDVKILFERLCKRTRPLTKAWVLHTRATLLSMAFNGISMKLIKSQETYPDNYDAPDIFDDFSILIRGPDDQNPNKERTESGDVSNFLENLLENLVEENLLDKIKKMDSQTLYRLLTASDGENSEHKSIINPNSKSVRLFKEFIAKNGHRAFKEFDFATLTWSDDPSLLMQSILLRAKGYNNQKEKRQRQELANEEQKKRYESIVSDKITKNKFLLMNVVLPRARRAILTREKTKSLLIKTVDKYRRAMRYLGAQLCLLGVLPSADLLYHFSIEELDIIVQCGSSGKDYERLARILYKARRRQQRQRLYNNIPMPEPTVEFENFHELIAKISDEGRFEQQQAVADDDSNLDSDPNKNSVARGLVSCSGKVTGRAFVASSIDQMDQIQPNDILITYSIDISWTVYFFAISGIVTEVGGIVSHGAVVAREYGIPTLCTAMGACSKFRTGQIVTLDANKGVCYPAEEEHGKT